MKSKLHIAIVDCSASGHRQTYYQQFARTLTEAGHGVSLIVPQADEELLKTNGELAKVHVTPISTRPLLPLPVGRPLKKKVVVLRNAVILLQNLYTVRKQVKAVFNKEVAQAKATPMHQERPLVFFPCLDDILPTLTPLWLLNLLFPLDWCGLLLQMPRKGGLIDPRRCLRTRRCKGVAILNELAIPSLKAFQPHIVLFPDMADDAAPNTGYALLQEVKARAQGRKVISLLGSINARKGTELLQRTLPLLPASDYFFLIAGQSSLTPAEDAQLRSLAATHTNLLFAPQRIPDEACFNALVNESSLLFAVYRQFTGSSNLLTKAALFGKPIVVAKGACMEHRVTQYGTGLAVNETDAEACAAAIRQLCEATPLPADGLARYAANHSVAKLTESFHLLFNDEP